jgi:hypothetical protein
MKGFNHSRAPLLVQPWGSLTPTSEGDDSSPPVLSLVPESVRGIKANDLESPSFKPPLST